jgi:aspartyl-tRNA(Asn)/glutamyl-tRNA(Gln) amidotransferase subunit A
MGTDQWDLLDPEVQRSAEWAAKLGPADVIAAQDECHLLNRTLLTLLHEHTFLLTPTVAGRTPASGEWGTVDGEPSINWVRFTYPFNLTRSPAGSVFVGRTDDGLPVGLQVVGPQHADAAVLRMLAWMEEVAGCTDVAPVG